MNSYDIFRKLTKGIKFTNKKNNNNSIKAEKYQQSENKAENQDGQTITTDTNNIELNGERQDSVIKDEVDTGGGESVGGGVQVLAGLELSNAGDNQRNKRKKKKSNKDHKQILLEQKQEQVNHARKKLGIQIWGTDVPAPIDCFQKLASEYGVNDVLVANLQGQGYQDPTPIQAQAWPLLLSHRDTLASAPTGSGKTAGFVLPLLHRLRGPQRKGFRALILAPTRELATQTHRECVRLSEGLGIRTVIITNVNKAREKYGPQSAHKFDVLVTTPNRLIFLLRESDDGPPISLDNVEMLVVDESDRLFEEGGGKGGGFREQLGEIYRSCSHPSVTRAFFSATHAHPVQHWCSLNLNNPAMVTVGIRNTACKDVQQTLQFCGDEGGKLLALRDIIRKGYEPPVLVFVQTKERAKELFRELVYDNIMVDAIHSDRTQAQRDNVVRAFRERRIWVLVCTELMGRGIDFKGVNLVINYDLPPSSVSYIHRVGRTGRAGRQGKAVTFWTMQDKPFIRSIAQVIRDAGQEVPQWMLELKKTSRKEKRSLATKQPDRGRLSEAVYYEQLAKQKKKQMKAKRKKQTLAKTGEAGDDDEQGVAEMEEEAGNTETTEKPRKRRKTGKKSAQE